MNDDVRMLIMATAQSVFPVLNIIGVLNLTADEISLIMVLFGNLVLLAARVLKKGQSAG
jgi:hypothetical protein